MGGGIGADGAGGIAVFAASGKACAGAVGWSTNKPSAIGGGFIESGTGGASMVMRVPVHVETTVCRILKVFATTPVGFGGSFGAFFGFFSFCFGSGSRTSSHFTASPIVIP
jgi:hypothetical protein